MLVQHLAPSLRKALKAILPYLPRKVRKALKARFPNLRKKNRKKTVMPPPKNIAAKPDKTGYDYPFQELPFFARNKELNAHLSAAAVRLDGKLRRIAPRLKEIGMSRYSQRYMDKVFGTPHRRHYNLTKYGHILSKALEPCTVADLENIVLVDYGGGHGTLSLLAKEAGVGEVIHSDIFETSSMDARLLAMNIKAAPGAFYIGDTPDFLKQMGPKKANVIVNYDVLEHVYNFRQYFIDLAAVTAEGGRWYMGSGANLYNASLREQLIETHNRFEGNPNSDSPQMHDTDSESTYLDARMRLIYEIDPSLLPEEIARLAAATRGWRRKDIERCVAIYISSGHVVEFCPPLNNTADPENGNWCENMVPIETYTEHAYLKSVAKEITVETSARWGSFIKSKEHEMSEWRTRESQDVVEALKHAPYYCLRVQF